MSDFDQRQARAWVADIEAIGASVRRSFVYRRAGLIVAWWGVLTFAGYMCIYFAPQLARAVWIAVFVLGVAGILAGLAIGRPKDQRFNPRWALTILVFIGFGVLWSRVLTPMAGRELATFWTSYFMLAYTIAGIWFGGVFALIGLCVAGASFAAFFWAGPAFVLWMAAINGLGLTVAGLWMRRL